MKNKSIIRLAALAGVVTMLASCSSSNKFASSFAKRRYNKGYFVDFGSKSVNPKANKTNGVVSTVSSGTAKVTEAVAPKTVAANVAVQKALPLINQVSSVSISKSANHVSGSPRSAEVPVTEVKNQSKLPTIVATNNNTTKISEAANPPHSGGGSCKSWIACLLLCFFLGGLGIHRFYMGYTWQGIVQLLTAGGCGIWALIDFIRIIIKDLKPKGGDYCA